MQHGITAGLFCRLVPHRCWTSQWNNTNYIFYIWNPNQDSWHPLTGTLVQLWTKTGWFDTSSLTRNLKYNNDNKLDDSCVATYIHQFIRSIKVLYLFISFLDIKCLFVYPRKYIIVIYIYIHIFSYLKYCWHVFTLCIF